MLMLLTWRLGIVLLTWAIVIAHFMMTTCFSGAMLFECHVWPPSKTIMPSLNSARKLAVKFDRQVNEAVCHYSDVIMSAMTSQITGVSMVYATFCPGADQRKHQNSASLAFVRGIHRWPMDSLHLGPVTRKMFHLMMSSCHPNQLCRSKTGPTPHVKIW